MRFYPQMYPYVWYNFNNSRVRIGVNNNLKNLLNYNLKTLKNFKLEVHNEKESSIVYPMSIVTNIVNPTIHKTYRFYSPCVAEIIRFNPEITLNPSKILTNNEMDNWVVELKKLEKTEYPNYFSFDYPKMFYSESKKNQQEFQCYD